MKKPWVWFILVIVLMVAAYVGVNYYFGHRHPPNSWAAVSGVLEKCAAGDLLAGKTLKFGFSNDIGPGSIWKEDKNGLVLSFALDELEPDQAKRIGFVRSGPSSTCEGSEIAKLTLSGSANAAIPETPVVAGLKADLKRGSNVSASISQWSNDLLSSERYKALLAHFQGAPYDRVFRDKNVYVAMNALRIDGFRSEYEFSSDVAAELKGKYTGLIRLPGTASLGAEWNSENHLVLTSNQPLYILASATPITDLIPAQSGSPGDVSSQLADLQLKESVTARLQEAEVETRDLNIQVTSHAVTIGGPIDSEESKARIERLVAATQGVLRVDNNLNVEDPCVFAGQKRQQGQTPGCGCGALDVSIVPRSQNLHVGDNVCLQYDASQVCQGQSINPFTYRVTWQENVSNSLPAIYGTTTHRYRTPGMYKVSIDIYGQCYDTGKPCTHNCEAKGETTLNVR